MDKGGEDRLNIIFLPRSEATGGDRGVFKPKDFCCFRNSLQKEFFVVVFAYVALLLSVVAVLAI